MMLSFQSNLIECPFCSRTFQISLKGHLKIHFTGEHILMRACEQYAGVNVAQMYVSGMSANEIMNAIREKCTWARPIKGHVLKYLDALGVKRRKTSDAMVVYYDRNDIWNKGLTSDDHEGIAKYANSRHGDANPIHKTTSEQRSYTNIINRLKREGRLDELEGLHFRRAKAVREWYDDPENRAKYDKAYDEARTKQKAAVQAGVDAYYAKYAALGVPAPNKVASISGPELIVKDALDALSIKYQHQWYFGRANFDFLLTGLNVVVEENGTYWHAHPSMFPYDDMVHPDKHMTAGDIRKRDEEKRLMLERHGYKLVVVWEHEFSTLEEAVSLLADRLPQAGVVLASWPR
jgi:G:T-mismatch repair DNA endonuclease (very short patch repair protein)